MSEYTLGIDLNRYRPNFNIALAKEHGVRFVMGKATEVWMSGGKLVKWEDPSYKGYEKQCKDAGVPFSGYFYWRAGIDAEEQVDWFFEVAKKHIDFPPQIDVERYNNVGVLSQKDAHQNILECAMLLEDVYNLSPILYTSWYAWQSLTGGGELAGLLPIWTANWTNHHTPMLPSPATEWDYWQFTSSYPLPGQPKTCDASRYNGNEAEFTEYVKVSRSIMYPEAPPPPPIEPPPDPTTQSIYLELSGDKWIGEVRKVS